MRSVAAWVDRLHAWVVSRPALVVLSILARVLLALAFVPSGLVKIRGEPFTTLPVTDPVGYFFSGFFSAPAFYRFVGVAQWVAGVLLLVPSAATVGALVYLPIAVNIFVITVAVRFGGTEVITGGMLLANLWLLFWDQDRLRGLVGSSVAVADVRARHGDLVSSLGMFGAATVGFFGMVRAHVGRLRGGVPGSAWAMLVVGAVVGVGLVVRAYGAASLARTDIRAPDPVR